MRTPSCRPRSRVRRTGSVKGTNTKSGKLPNANPLLLPEAAMALSFGKSPSSSTLLEAFFFGNMFLFHYLNDFHTIFGRDSQKTLILSYEEA